MGVAAAFCTQPSRPTAEMEPAAAQGLHQRPLSHYDATMSTQAILLDDRIEQLADLLERRAVPFGGLGLEALDGFFSALAVAPDGIDEAQWQAVRSEEHTSELQSLMRNS